ncbi:class II aldolase/adducin family protein [Patescibacteria group bacterium]|nr:class II aldolase/adducin family protein [Patescibacteria group bacterium]
MSTEADIRKELTLYGKKIVQKGLVVATGGNISARKGNIVYLSPGGFTLDEIAEGQWAKVELKTGKIIKPILKPTCEINMHLICYRTREDIGAVVHTHPPYVTGVVSAGVKIKPMFPDYVAYLGEEVPLLQYITPAGNELAKAIGKIIGKYNAISLKNHGALTVGSNLKEAFHRSMILEEAAKILFISKIMGTPGIFNPSEVKKIKNLVAEVHRQKLPYLFKDN